jgi:hypothetical protein
VAPAGRAWVIRLPGGSKRGGTDPGSATFVDPEQRRTARRSAKGVADRLGIRHLLCDADTADRQALGLRVGQELVAHAMAVSKKTGIQWPESGRQF